MSSYDVNREIVYAVRDTHRFDEIFVKLTKPKSRVTFSKYLDQLVKSGLIKRTIKENRPYYSLDDTEEYRIYEEFKEMIDDYKKTTPNIEKQTKKYSDKKLLREFVKDSVMLLNQLSYASFRAMVTKHKAEQTQIHEWEKELRQSIKIRIQILEKRNSKLVKMYHDLTAIELIGI